MANLLNKRKMKFLWKLFVIFTKHWIPLYLWTLYYTKHRNWFHESLAMLEIFTKLPLKIWKFWFLYRQAVRNSLKNLIFLDLTIFRASSRFVFQVTTEELYGHQDIFFQNKRILINVPYFMEQNLPENPEVLWSN